MLLLTARWTDDLSKVAAEQTPRISFLVEFCDMVAGVAKVRAFAAIFYLLAEALDIGPEHWHSHSRALIHPIEPSPAENVKTSPEPHWLTGTLWLPLDRGFTETKKILGAFLAHRTASRG